MNKKGMEMGINVIVGIILGMMMLGAGILIFTQVIDLTQEVTFDVDQATEKLMMDSFYTGEKLQVLKTDVVAKGKNPAVFIYGVHNIFAEASNFSIKITSSSTTLNQEDIIYLTSKFELDAKEKIVKQFLVFPNANVKRNSQESMTFKVLFYNETGEYEYAKLPLRVIKQ